MEKGTVEASTSHPRKASPPPDDQEDEEKMDRFYELIRRFKQARDDHQRRFLQKSSSILPLKFRHHNYNHNIIELHDQERHRGGEDLLLITNKKKMMMRMENEDHHQQPSWVPSFKWEDFKDTNNQDQDQDQDQAIIVSNSNSNSNSNTLNNTFGHFLGSSLLDDDRHDHDTKKKRKIGDHVDDDDSKDPQINSRLDLNLTLSPYN